jgi:MFS family permease
MMICAGAAEQAMGQWASSFAESGLGVSKALGDLLGPCLFAILMGIARVVYGCSGGKINLLRFIVYSSILCFISFLIAALTPIPLIALIGCALCGLSVGIMWPGTYSLAASRIHFGGVQMFAYLALAGDVGCLLGPTAAGWIAEAFGNNFKISFLVSIIFPVLILIMVYLGFRKKRSSQKQ